ncbi:MAG: helix-turn-helix transcriptional regulator [Bdellovibrionales bacterium]|nr:helix-turn-helix transcriptional regulator [Bdellovibrionales bacterium]
MANSKHKPSLDVMMRALGDPLRLSVVRQLLAVRGEEKACGTFEHGVTKATFSHHMAILEEAGVVQARQEGTRKMISLRLSELKKDYPGLIELVERTCVKR